MATQAELEALVGREVVYRKHAADQESRGILRRLSRENDRYLVELAGNRGIPIRSSMVEVEGSTITLAPT